MRRAGLVSTVPALSVPVLSVAALVTSLVLGTAGGAAGAPVRPALPSPASGGVGNHLVALGDSWAAGSAAGEIDRATGACRRSTLAYPPRVAAGIAQLHWTSKACATASPAAAPTTSTPTSPTTTTPTSPTTSTPTTSPTKPGTAGPVDSAVGTALGTSVGGLLGGGLGKSGERADTQFGVIDANTHTVIATVGGDAVGLGALARACSTAGTTTSCDAAAGRTDRALTALPKTLDASLAEMHRRAPAAVIVLSGYPRLTEGVACAKGAADLARAARVDAVVDRLDGVLAARAGAARARFVDVRPAFRGHSACAPDAWLTPLSGPDALLAGGPTAAGQTRGYVPAIIAAVRAGAPAPASAAAEPGKPTRPTKPADASAPTTRPAPGRDEDQRTASDGDLTQPLFAG